MNTASWLKVQAVSGLVFSAFLSLHLLNTLSAVAGAGSYDAFQRSARLFYQQAAIELLGVAASLLLHVAVSVALMQRRRRARSAAHPPLWLRLHRYSAYVLLAFVFTHALATRGVGLLAHVPVAAQYLTFTLSGWPAFFYPYYALFFAAGAYHLLSGVRLALSQLRLLDLKAWAPQRLYAVCAVTVLLGGLGLLALGGILHPAPIPDRTSYERLSARFLPTFLLRPARR